MTFNWHLWKAPEETSYDDYVIHPRYGQGPRITGSNPDPKIDGEIRAHWRGGDNGWIPNTAVGADLSLQNNSGYSVTHYFDEPRVCRDCKSKFIFFAEEQKHWYEELGFSLNSDCVRCVECRKTQQGLGRLSAQYVELMALPNRTTEQSLEMVGCCLALVEAGSFNKRQTSHIRQILNASVADWKSDPSFAEILGRLQKIEAGPVGEFGLDQPPMG